MTQPKITINNLPAGELTFKAPLTYCIGETDDQGRLNLTKANAQKKVLVIII